MTGAGPDKQGRFVFGLEPAEVPVPAPPGLFGLGLLCALSTREKSPKPTKDGHVSQGRCE